MCEHDRKLRLYNRENWCSRGYYPRDTRHFHLERKLVVDISCITTFVLSVGISHAVQKTVVTTPGVVMISFSWPRPRGGFSVLRKTIPFVAQLPVCLARKGWVIGLKTVITAAGMLVGAARLTGTQSIVGECLAF